MKCGRIFLVPLLLAFALAIPSVAQGQKNERQKAEKQLRRITAMASDVTARSIVNRTMAAWFKVDRLQLVRERRAMGLDYGSLFVAHELTAAGAKMLEDVALPLRSHQSISQIADRRNLNWKQLSADARKLNDKIADNIYEHFLHDAIDKKRDLAERYDATSDWVRADAGATQAEILEAQAEYVLWRDKAAKIGDTQVNVNSADELASHRLEDQTHVLGHTGDHTASPRH